MQERLEGKGSRGTIHFRILDGKSVREFSVRLGKARGGAGKERADDKMEATTTLDTWMQIASGALAPLDAFGMGLLRVRGNYRLGAQVMKHLAADDGLTDIC